MYPLEKHLKLGSKLRSNLTTINEYSVPELRISGKWLSAICFQVGSHVEITVREELLIIKPNKKSESSH